MQQCQQQTDRDLHIKDRLRLALAFAVLECKPEKETTSAFIVRLRQLHHAQINHSDQASSPSGSNACRSLKQPTGNLRLSSVALRDSNAQVADLEQEVRNLKRKSSAAENDFAQKPPSRHHEPRSDASLPSPLAVRNKSNFSRLPLPAEASPRLAPVRAETSSTTRPGKEFSRGSHAGTSSPVKEPATELARPSKDDKVSIVAEAMGARKGDRMVDDEVDDDLSGCLAETTADDDGGLAIPGSRASFDDLPQDVTLLQSLLLSPCVCATSTSPHLHTGKISLMEQSLKVISKLSHVLRLALSTYRRNIQANHGIPQSQSQVNGDDKRTGSADAVEMVGLVERLVSQLVPQVIRRLQHEEKGRFVLAVAKGIIKPCIEAITTTYSGRRQQSSPAQSRHVEADERMLACIQSLLNALSRSAATTAGATVAEPPSRPVYPFAETVSLQCTEALCIFVRDFMQHRQDIDIGSTTCQRFETGFTHMVIVTMVQLAQGCFEHLLPTDMTRAEDQDGTGERERAASKVRTRVCDHLTNVAADLQLEVEVVAENHSATSNHTDDDKTQQGTSNGQDQGHMEPLWIRMGMKRETMVAICRLAEHMMIGEYREDSGESMMGGVYDWLEMVLEE